MDIFVTGINNTIELLLRRTLQRIVHYSTDLKVKLLPLLE
jgi:hypothetical protein